MSAMPSQNHAVSPPHPSRCSSIPFLRFPRELMLTASMTVLSVRGILLLLTCEHRGGEHACIIKPRR
jgi:hypothetical protein